MWQNDDIFVLQIVSIAKHYDSSDTAAWTERYFTVVHRSADLLNNILISSSPLVLINTQANGINTSNVESCFY